MKLVTHSKKIIFNFFLLLTVGSAIFSAPVLARDKKSSHLLMLEGGVLGGRSSSEDVFFESDQPHFKYNTVTASGGYEFILPNSFSFKLRAGYQSLFYTSREKDEIAKRFFLADLATSYYFLADAKKFDPYLLVGTAFFAGSHGSRFFAEVGSGVRISLPWQRWHFRTELLGQSDFGKTRNLHLRLGFDFSI